MELPVINSARNVAVNGFSSSPTRNLNQTSLTTFEASPIVDKKKIDIFRYRRGSEAPSIMGDMKIDGQKFG
jgi:hypothetical protein